MAAGFTPLDPWDTSAPEAQAFVAAQGMSDPAIREVRVALAVRSLALRNLRMLDAADGVLAVLDGTDVDSGTAGEIGYASAIGTPIVGVRLDFRRTGEEGAGVNAQVEHFIERTGGLVLVCPPAVFHDSRAFLDAAVARLSLLILA